MGFIDTDGIPKDRYYHFLDRGEAARVVAEGIKEAYSDLFAINKKAQDLSTEEAKNKLRTLYKGAKKDNLLGRIASTFTALCDYADFSATTKTSSEETEEEGKAHKSIKGDAANERSNVQKEDKHIESELSVESLQYHINIVLPESRDQAVYDAIFKSLRDHLGSK